MPENDGDGNPRQEESTVLEKGKSEQFGTLINPRQEESTVLEKGKLESEQLT